MYPLKHKWTHECLLQTTVPSYRPNHTTLYEVNFEFLLFCYNNRQCRQFRQLFDGFFLGWDLLCY